MNKYAIVEEGEEGFVLSIGQDVPGLVSHGAAIPVGLFQTEEEAIAFAEVRGIERIE